MGSSCHPSAAALGMTFFQQMCQLVAVLGMHHHLKALAGFGLFGRHPASFVCTRSGRCIGRDLVFDRFYSADPSRTDKHNFGLGLSVAKELARLHHADLTVTDTPGGGAKFAVTFAARIS